MQRTLPSTISTIGSLLLVLTNLGCTSAASTTSTAAAAAAAPPAVTIEREPARMLQAENSHILLAPMREDLERPEEILDRMQLEDGDIVADLGAGVGFYTLRLAPRVAPRGLVFAVDVQQGMLDRLAERATEQDVAGFHPVLGKNDDPLLPPGKVDWVLLVDVYHEIQEPAAMLQKIKEALAPGGRVALLEYRAEQTDDIMPAFIPRDHKMSVDEVLGEWLPAGFELVERLDFLPAQHYFILKVAGDE